MSATLEDSNAKLRASVKARLDATPADDPKMVGYAKESCCDGGRCTTKASRATPAEQTLHLALEAVRDRHSKYGPPTAHFGRTAALVNAAFGTNFTPADWALVMILDKVARQLGPEATDDSPIDIAGYAACHQECRRA